MLVMSLLVSVHLYPLLLPHAGQQLLISQFEISRDLCILVI